jgi:hypothetical protein
MKAEDENRTLRSFVILHSSSFIVPKCPKISTTTDSAGSAVTVNASSQLPNQTNIRVCFSKVKPRAKRLACPTPPWPDGPIQHAPS